MALNRSWTRARGPGGTDEAVRTAGALAEVAGEELLESIINGVAALHQFGGQLFIAGVRRRVDENGEITEDQKAERETVAYVIHYSSKPPAVLGDEEEPAPQEPMLVPTNGPVTEDVLPDEPEPVAAEAE